jgi:hypothetical protein
MCMFFVSGLKNRKKIGITVIFYFVGGKYWTIIGLLYGESMVINFNSYY